MGFCLRLVNTFTIDTGKYYPNRQVLPRLARLTRAFEISAVIYCCVLSDLIRRISAFDPFHLQRVNKLSKL